MAKIPEWAIKAQQALKITTLIPWSSGEVHGSCPQCGGKDRLIIWSSGRSWCRQCRYSKSWKNGATGDRWTEEKRAKARAAARAMHQETIWMDYHKRALDLPKARDLWLSYGLETDALMRWGLGYADKCPTYPSSPSLTIPVFGQGSLLDIRHRLIKTSPNSGKYRSHVPGLALTVNLFNRDALRVPKCLVVEGEIKSIVLEQHGIAACGIYGMGGYGELLKIAKQTELSVVVALDPDAEDQAWDLCSKLSALGSEVWIAFFMLKPDDFILRYGLDLTNEVLRQSQRVKK